MIQSPAIRIAQLWCLIIATYGQAPRHVTTPTSRSSALGRSAPSRRLLVDDVLYKNDVGPLYGYKWAGCFEQCPDCGKLKRRNGVGVTTLIDGAYGLLTSSGADTYVQWQPSAVARSSMSNRPHNGAWVAAWWQDGAFLGAYEWNTDIFAPKSWVHPIPDQAGRVPWQNCFFDAPWPADQSVEFTKIGLKLKPGYFMFWKLRVFETDGWIPHFDFPPHFDIKDTTYYDLDRPFSCYDVDGMAVKSDRYLLRPDNTRVALRASETYTMSPSEFTQAGNYTLTNVCGETGRNLVRYEATFTIWLTTIQIDPSYALGIQCRQTRNGLWKTQAIWPPPTFDGCFKGNVTNSDPDCIPPNNQYITRRAPQWTPRVRTVKATRDLAVAYTPNYQEDGFMNWTINDHECDLVNTMTKSILQGAVPLNQSVGTFITTHKCDDIEETRSTLVRPAIWIDGLDDSVGSVELVFRPQLATWADPLNVFNPRDWRISSGLECCDGLTATAHLQEMVVWGHRALYLEPGKMLSAQVYADFREGSVLGMYLLSKRADIRCRTFPNFTTRLAIRNLDDPGKVVTVDGAGIIPPKYATLIKISIVDGAITCQIGATILTGVLPGGTASYVGQPWLTGLQIFAGNTGARFFDVMLKSPARYGLKCCGTRGAHAKEILVVGQPGTPAITYTPPQGECIWRDKATAAITVIAVAPNPPTIANDQVKVRNVVYRCEYLGMVATRTLQVTVRFAFTLIGPQKMKARLRETFQDPGCSCIDASGKTLEVTRSPRIFSTREPATVVLTYSCMIDGNTLLRTRELEITNALTMHGPEFMTLHEPKDYVELSAHCVNRDSTESEAEVTVYLEGDDKDTLVSSIKDQPAPEVGMQVYRVEYTCKDGTSESRTVFVTTGEPACEVYGLGGDGTVLMLLVNETYEDPQVCCIEAISERALEYTEAVTGELETGVPGSQSMVYTCQIWDTATCSREVQVNTAPTIYMLGEPSTKALFSGQYIDAGATCIDVEDGILPMKKLGDVVRLPILRGGAELPAAPVYLEDIPIGSVQSIYDEHGGSCDTAGGFKKNKLSCFRDMQAPKNTEIVLDMGTVRIVHSVTVAGYSYNANTAKIRVSTIFGTTEMPCIAEAVFGKLMCSPRPARYIKIRPLTNGIIICEVMPFGRPSPRPSAKLRLDHGCGVVPYICSLFDGTGALGIQYQCMDRSNGDVVGYLKKIPKADPKVSAMSSGELWVLMSPNGAIMSQAEGGSPMPPGEGWSKLCGEVISFANADLKCRTCSGWPATMCVDDSTQCVQSTGFSYLAHIEMISSVNVLALGTYRVTYTCTDSAGESSSVTRIVQVTCEAPDPWDPVYGGNRVACKNSKGNQSGIRDWEACAALCAGKGNIELCAAYEFNRITGVCSFFATCTGKLERDPQRGFSDTWLVGYCRRRNTPPDVVVDTTEILIAGSRRGDAIAPACRCSDLEDSLANPCTSTWLSVVLNSAGYGRRRVDYTCMDSEGLMTVESQNVTLVMPCKIKTSAQTKGCKGIEVVEMGDECTVECESGYFPTWTKFHCVLNLATETPEDVMWLEAQPRNETWEWCSPDPCREPTGIKSVFQEDGNTEPCVESYGSLVPSGAVCTTRCEQGFVPSVRELSCDRGVLQPDTFQCLTISQGATMVSGIESTTDVQISWSLGDVGDCNPVGMQLQARKANEANEDAWKFLDGTKGKCGQADLKYTGRTREELQRIGCNATAILRDSQKELLVGGQGYVFRMREVCAAWPGGPSMTSAWTESVVITVMFVPRPNISFCIPSPDEKLFSSPELVIALVQTPVELNPERKGTNAAMRLTRHQSPNPDCTFRMFEKRIREIDDRTEKAGQAGGAGLGSNAIITFTPDSSSDSDEGMFFLGCKYTFTIDPGVLRTLLQPSKENLLLEWSFEWAELGPRCRTLGLASSPHQMEPDGVRAKYSVLYDEQEANVSCTANAADAGNISSAAWDSVDWVQSNLRMQDQTGALVGDRAIMPPFSQAEVRRTPLFNASKGQMKTFEFTGLVPDANYTIRCTGTTRERWWTPTRDEGKYFLEKLDADESMNTLYINITRLLVCPDRPLNESDFPSFHRDNPTLVKVLDPTYSPERVNLVGNNTQIDGLLFQAESWPEACNVSDFPAGSVAYLRLHAAVMPMHRYSRVIWTKGPYIDVKYVKAAAGDPPTVVVRPLSYRVCAQRVKKCLRYTTDIAFVYGTIGIEQVVVQERGKSEVVVQRGTVHKITPGARIIVTIKEKSLKVSDMGISLGKRFRQVCDVDVVSGTLSFDFVGVGIDLPLNILYLGSAFVSDYKFITPQPVVSVKPASKIVTLSAPGNPVAECSLHYSLSKYIEAKTNVPPDVVFRIRVQQRKRPEQDLCIPGSWRMDGWQSISCDLAKAPLTDLEVVVTTRNFSDPGMNPFIVARTVGFNDPDLAVNPDSDIKFMTPTISCLSESRSCVDSTLSISQYTMQAVGEKTLTENMYIMGTNFPDPEEMTTFGQGPPWDYHLYALSGRGKEPLCQSISWRQPNVLECKLERCLDAREMLTWPPIIFTFGEFSLDKRNMLELATPVVEKITPPTLNDTGFTVVTLEGYNFGHPLNQTEDFQKACQAALKADQLVTQGAGKVRSFIKMFGELRVRVGTAICEVWNHTENTARCAVDSPVRPVRSQPGTGEKKGRIVWREAVLVKTSLGVGEVIAPPDVRTVVTLCPDGQRRIHPERTECELCHPGTIAVAGKGESPLECSPCPSTSYQDKAGASSCEPCPAGTLVKVGSGRSRQDCECMPGYYSPVWNANKTNGLPGYPCKSCSTEDMVATPPRGKLCGRDIVVRLVCDEELQQTCVTLPSGQFSYRTCKAYCPGGISLPISKPEYFNIGSEALSDTTGANLQHWRPELVRCEPAKACASRNRCAVGYGGDACQACVFGYYRERLEKNICKKCDEASAIGTVIMSGCVVLLTFGAFMGSLIYMKALADPIFKAQAFAFCSRTADNVIKAFTLKGGNAGARRTTLDKLYRAVMHKKCTVRVTKEEVGSYFNYYRNGDLGLVFRVDDDTGVVYVVDIRSNSPMKSCGVQRGWELRLVNGRRIRAHTEVEVRLMLVRSRFPISLTFRFGRFQGNEEDKEEEDVAAADAQAQAEHGQRAYDSLRMTTMTLSILQSFTAIARLDVEWPPIFRYFSKLIGNITLDFSFFHPECSVATPYEQIWVFFLCLPYAVILSMTFAYLFLRVNLALKLDMNSEHREMNEWLLRNAWFRAVLTVLLLFVSNHMELLWSPFTCIARDNGDSVMMKAQDIQCDLQDSRYVYIWSLAVCGWTILSGVYAFLFWCMYKGYFWQVGTRVRSQVPAYVAAVETGVSGMKGFEPSLTFRVMFNLVGPVTFPPGVTKGQSHKAEHQTLTVSERLMDFRSEAAKAMAAQVLKDKEAKELARHREKSHRLSNQYDSDHVEGEEEEAQKKDHVGMDTTKSGPSSPSARSTVAKKSTKPERDALSRQGWEAYFSQIDRAEPGRITKTEFARQQTFQMKLYTALDAGGEGSISLDAWLKFYDDYEERDDVASLMKWFVGAKGVLREHSRESSGHGIKSGVPRPSRSLISTDKRSSEPIKESMGTPSESFTKTIIGNASQATFSSGKKSEPVKDFQQWEGALSKFGINDPHHDGRVTREQWNQSFKCFDRNHSGSISKAEFKQQRVFKKSCYTTLDPELTGHVSKEAWLAGFDFLCDQDGLLPLDMWLSDDVARPAAGGGDESMTKPSESLTKTISGNASQATFSSGKKSEPVKDFKQWEGALSKFGIDGPNHEGRVTREQWNHSFKSFDINSSGSISKAEFNRQRVLKQSLYTTLDPELTGHVSEEAWLATFDSLCDRDGLVPLDTWLSDDVVRPAAGGGVEDAGGKKPQVSSERLYRTADSAQKSEGAMNDTKTDSANESKKADTGASAKKSESSRTAESFQKSEGIIHDNKTEGTTKAEIVASARESERSASANLESAASAKTDVAMGTKSANAVPKKRESGKISKLSRPELLAKFGVGGANHDGRLTREQWAQGFAAFDRDASGEISRSEFKERKVFKKSLYTALDPESTGGVTEAAWAEGFDKLCDKDGLVPLDKWVADDIAQAPHGGGHAAEMLATRSVPTIRVSNVSIKSDRPAVASKSESAVTNKKHKKHISWPKLLAMFGIDDPAHDGRLTKEEWGRGYAAVDADASGDISKSEIREQGIFKKSVYTTLDPEASGHISLEAWLAGFDHLAKDGRVSLEKWVADGISRPIGTESVPVKKATTTGLHSKRTTGSAPAKKLATEASHGAVPADVEVVPSSPARTLAHAAAARGTRRLHRETAHGTAPPSSAGAPSLAQALARAPKAKGCVGSSNSTMGGPVRQPRVLRDTQGGLDGSKSPLSAQAKTELTRRRRERKHYAQPTPGRRFMPWVEPSEMMSTRLKQETERCSKTLARERRKKWLWRSAGVAKPGLRTVFQPGATLVTTTRVQRDAIIAREQFWELGRIRWPDVLTGSFLSYGWVLLINNFGRTFLLLMTVCLTASIPPIAASGQACVFFLNFAVLLLVQPYQNKFLSLQEALLIGCLALLVWAASFRDLLQSHRRAQDFPDTVELVGNLMDIIVLALVIIITMGITLVAVLLLQATFSGESETQLLNRAYRHRARCIEKGTHQDEHHGDPLIAAAVEWLKEEEKHASMQGHLATLAAEILAFEKTEGLSNEDATKMHAIFKRLVKIFPKIAKKYKSARLKRVAAQAVASDDDDDE